MSFTASESVRTSRTERATREERQQQQRVRSLVGSRDKTLLGQESPNGLETDPHGSAWRFDPASASASQRHNVNAKAFIPPLCKYNIMQGPLLQL